MEVILLERVAKLGQIGDVVRVRDGFARNFLLAHGKALRATKENRTKFESMKGQLEARNLELKGEAETVAKLLDGQTFVLLRQAGEGGQLYGSVSTRDIAGSLTQGGFTVDRGQIVLNLPIKSIGLIKVPVQLHPEVVLTITVNVARSADEAERQARGEDLTKTRTDEEEDRAEAGGKAEKFFERGPKRNAEAAPAGEVPTEADAAAAGKKKREKAAKADVPGALAEEKPAKKRDKKSGEAKDKS